MSVNFMKNLSYLQKITKLEKSQTLMHSKKKFFIKKNLSTTVNTHTYTYNININNTVHR